MFAITVFSANSEVYLHNVEYKKSKNLIDHIQQFYQPLIKYLSNIVRVSLETIVWLELKLVKL